VKAETEPAAGIYSAASAVAGEEHWRWPQPP